MNEELVEGEQATTQHPRRWRKILIREWRHCEDQDYAREVYALISTERINLWPITILYMLVGALYFGPLGGLVVGIVTCRCVPPEDLKEWILTQRFWVPISPFIVYGVGIGGVAGLVVGYWVRWRTPWWRFPDERDTLLAGLVIRQPVAFLAGSIAGLVAGWLAWQLVGSLSGRPLELLTSLPVGLVVWLVIWQVVGLVLFRKPGVVPRLPDQVYARRSIFFWLRSRPLVAEVEAAMRVISTGPWPELLHRLDVVTGSRQASRPTRRPTPTPWMTKLNDRNWQERFLARHVLAALGGEAVEPLRRLDSPTAHWLLKSIAADTTWQFGPRAVSLLCPRCLVCCQQHRAPLKRGAVTYYGCRLCRQSVEWLETREVVALLDSRLMSTVLERRDGLLQVNWLQRGALFDFDRVVIVRAPDEAVERFCMQVGNDTDDYRRPRYRKMKYEVRCSLTENTRRILRHTFGEETG